MQKSSLPHMPQSFPCRYVQPSPPLVDDMYADLVPQIVQQLVSYLEITGPTTEDLFGGDPCVGKQKRYAGYHPSIPRWIPSLALAR